MIDTKALAASLLKSVHDYVAPALKAMDARLAALSEAIKAIPSGDKGERGEPGPRGEPGADGKDADPEKVRAAAAEEVAKAIAAIPAPKDGASVTLDDVHPLIQEQVARAVADIPRPQDGKDVDLQEMRAAIVEEVAKAIAVIPAPKDGTSVSISDVSPLIQEQVAKAVSDIPRPQDGKSIPVEDVQRMVDEAVGKAVGSIRLPKDGDPGRDAAHIEILPAIDETKSYPRGAYARHSGGLWRSFETTTGMRGWECIVEGVKSIAVDVKNDRDCFVSIETSGGAVTEKQFTVPAMIYRGVFREGEQYERGDTVTWAGSTWHCNDATSDKPVDGGKSWTLSVKKGRDGKDVAK